MPGARMQENVVSVWYCLGSSTTYVEVVYCVSLYFHPCITLDIGDIFGNLVYLKFVYFESAASEYRFTEAFRR